MNGVRRAISVALVGKDMKGRCSDTSVSRQGVTMRDGRGVVKAPILSGVRRHGELSRRGVFQRDHSLRQEGLTPSLGWRKLPDIQTIV